MEECGELKAGRGCPGPIDVSCISDIAGNVFMESEAAINEVRKLLADSSDEEN